MKALVFATAVLAATAFCAPASAAIFRFEAFLNGPSEVPPNASPGTGYGFVTFDDLAHTMRVEATFQDLLGNVTVAHIHGPTAVADTGTAGVATPTPTFPGFPSGVKFGSYDRMFDMTLASSYQAAFITAKGGTAATAEIALLQALRDNKAYLNIHTTTFGGGEIRGFFHAVPEPSTWALMILGFGATGSALRRRRAAVVAAA